MKVFIINHCATNKGDKAVLEFILHELAANGICEISVSANEPSCCKILRLAEGVQVRYVPWGWNNECSAGSGIVARIMGRLRRKFYTYSYAVVRRSLLKGKRPKCLPYFCNDQFWRELQSADIVVSTGGHHVTSILAPDVISPQSFEMALALLEGKPLYLWSQSIGPFEFSDEKHRQFIREILEQASGIYVRDNRSLDELSRLGVSFNKVHQTYESVLGFCSRQGTIAKPSERSPVVGISVYSVQARSSDEQSAYIAALRDIIDHVTAKGYKVLFFPMQLKGESSDDRPCIESVLEVVRDKSWCSIYPDGHFMLDHINEVAQCRFFIGHKTHSVIIALITGTPLLAISYHPKTNDFMEQYGLSENCIDDQLLTGDMLISLFDKLQVSMDAIGEQQLNKSRDLGEIVKHDFREMIFGITTPSD